MPGDRGQGRVRVCHKEIHKLLGYNIRQMIICYQQTMQCKAFSIKTLSFVDLYSEGAEPQRKMFADFIRKLFLLIIVRYWHTY